MSEKKDTCPCCTGTGKAPCEDCDGEGKVKCPECGGEGRAMKDCPVCDEGRVTKTRWINCSTCHGTGQVEGNYPQCKNCGYIGDACDNHSPCFRCGAFDWHITMLHCDECYGRGQIKETYYEICPNCNGEYHRDAGPCKTCEGTGKVKCKSCEGSGKETCDLCNGTGSINIEELCMGIIDVAAESSCRVDKDKVTDKMEKAIFVAANKGIGIAAYVAGNLCQQYEVSEDYTGGKGSYEYLKMSAETGNMMAQFALVEDCSDELDDDQEDTWVYIKKSAEQGFVPALERLAALYYDYEEEGSCCKIDWPKSLECWEKIIALKDKDSWNETTIKMAELHVKYLPAIIQGDASAMFELGKALLTQTCLDANTVISPNAQADTWFERVAETDDTSTLKKLAKYYWDEKGDKDAKCKANELYKKMADKGDAVSQSLFGLHLWQGDGIEKDACKALTYLYRAAEGGRIIAVRRLGHLYRDGDYVEKSRERANTLYARAAKSGDGWSLYEIGKCYLNGDCVKKDEVEAKRLLKMAAEKGVEKAKTALSSIPDTVKDKDKGPSGIVVGKPDDGPLPKFLKEDYDNAVAGKPAVKSSKKDVPVPPKEKKDKVVHTSTKKRWKFVVLGILFGFFGAHLAYAKRWLLFLLLWAGFITGNVMRGDKPNQEGASTETPATEVVAQQSIPDDKSNKGGTNPISGAGFAVWALLWIGGTLFIKKDGKGNRM